MFIKSGLWSLYTCLFFFFSWPLEVALFSKLASLTMTRKPKHNVQQFVILLYRVILPFDVKPFFCQQALMFWGTICSVFVSFVSIEGGQTVSGGDPADWENAKRLWPWGSLCWTLCRHYSGISPLWCVCLSPIWLENFWTWPACIRILDLDPVSNMGRNWKKKYIYCRRGSKSESWSVNEQIFAKLQSLSRTWAKKWMLHFFDEIWILILDPETGIYQDPAYVSITNRSSGIQDFYPG